MKVVLAGVVLGSVALGQSTYRVSVDASGAQANGGSNASLISADGRWIAFISSASNLVPIDTNGGGADVFVHDRLTGANSIVSLDMNGNQISPNSADLAMSPDGRLVAFTATIPSPTTGVVWVRDRQLNTSTIASISAVTGQRCDGGQPKLSADGRLVVFRSWDSNVVPNDTNGTGDVFLRDLQAGTTIQVDLDSNGVPANAGPAVSNGSFEPSISANGRYIAFSSESTNLVTGDTNQCQDVFLRDTLLGTTIRVSVGGAGAQAAGDCGAPAISGDGRCVAFRSSAHNLVPNPGLNGPEHVFLRDTLAGTTELVDVNMLGQYSNSGCAVPVSISGDGRFIAFLSWATDLVYSDTNGKVDVFQRDRQLATTRMLSLSMVGLQATEDCNDPSMSSDGAFTVFSSLASNLVDGDTNHLRDVFLIDPACTGGPTTYCAAKTNSLGCVPMIGTVGTPSQSGPDNFYVTASNVLNNKLGMLLWSLGPANNPFFGGTLCLQQPIVRTPAQLSGGSPTGSDCTGTYAYHFTQGYMLQHLLAVHSIVYAQWWSRDPGFSPPNTIGLTNGVYFMICP